MAFTRGQHRWRPPIEKVDKSRDLPRAIPPSPSAAPQHPLPPAQLRAQIVQGYKDSHDGDEPGREYVMKKLWEAAGVNAVAEPRLRRSGGVPLRGKR